MKKISDEKEKLIISHYLSGKSSRKCGELVGCSKTTCLKTLRRNNVSSRGYRKYNINHDFFSSIDDEKTAYWLGFMTADGNVHGVRIQLELWSKDKGHIQKFLNDMDSDYPIYDYERRGLKTSKMQIMSEKLTTDLKNIGVRPNKTTTVKPCNHIDFNLLRHYWRGIIDGDGHVGFKRGKYSLSPRVSLAGNYYMVDGFVKFLNFNGITINQKIYDINGSSYSIQIGTKGDCIKILHLLYKDCNVYLDRKYEKYITIMSETIGVF